MQLDPVQIRALDFSRDKPGIGWFIEMGLGKSFIALTEFDRLYKERKADRMIIICPNSFKMGWKDEITKHEFNFDVHIFRSAKKKEASAFVSTNHERPPVFIINFEAIRLPKVLAGTIKWARRGRTYLAIERRHRLAAPIAPCEELGIEFLPRPGQQISGTPAPFRPHVVRKGRPD